MLIPKADLSTLLPDAAARYVEQHGGAVRTGAKVAALQTLPDGRWQLDGEKLFRIVRKGKAEKSAFPFFVAVD